MNLATTISLALDALVRNKLRSLLTTLGIVIGVGAVVTMQSMGQGATAYVSEAISGLGSNMLIVIPGSGRGMGVTAVPLFTTFDLDALRKHVHDAQHVAATRASMLRVVAGANNHITNVGGVSPEYFTIRSWDVSHGRSLQAEDERQASLHCVIGQSVADQLFPGQDPVGHELRLRALPCRVIGLLTTKGGSAFGSDQDDVVFMPFSTFSRRIAGNSRISAFMISADSPEKVDAAKRDVEQLLRQRRHVPPGETDDFTVRDPRELQAVMQNVTSMLTTLLAGVAAISLLVGGIGIMNIMLVSVTERTREIGIRLAVGARTLDILLQFLVEAVFLSSVGGALGIVLGLSAARAVAAGIDIPFVVPILAIPLAFAVSVAVGVVFGVFPARKAARLHPLAALRFE
jgi:putative ABC transport system permease protein